MPPRSAKKGAAATRKAPTRTPKSAQKSQVHPQNTEEKIEEAPVPVVEVKEEVKIEETKVEEIVKDKAEEKPSEPEPAPKSEAKGNLLAKEGECVKEPFDADDKDERLELDDNDPEYEPEEEAGVEYDERKIEHEDGQEADEGEEEGDTGEEGDMVDEEMGGEDEEGEEDVENVEEHEDIAEEEEHHELVKERRKRKEFEVFVGGLDKDATEEDLRKAFSTAGEIVDVRLMMNPQTKKNKGFAFIRFATVEQAKRAVSELKKTVINGKECGCNPSQDNDTLFLGNICKTWTMEALKEKLKHYGVESIEDLTLIEDGSNEGMNRGFAFLEFSSRSDAMNAYKRLSKRDVVFGVDRPAKVSFAESFIEPDEKVMAQVRTVFVDYLPASWDEENVKMHLKKFGEIEKIELARNRPTAKRKDFAFVTFDTHDAAVACAEAINNKELGDGEKKVKVRARLSRPHTVGRGKRGGREDHRFGLVSMRGGRGSWALAPSRRLPARAPSGIGGYGASLSARGIRRPIGGRDRRPVMAVPERVRHLPPHERSYERRPQAPPYPKSSSKRDYVRRDEVPPRGRAALDYGSRMVAERRPSYKDDDYDYHGSGYSDIGPRSRTGARRAYVDEDYAQRFERLSSSYHEGRSRDYESISGSKRPYSALDDAPSRYADPGVRGSRARLDYGYSGNASQYGDVYSERLGRSHLGYGGSSSSFSGQESPGLYGGRHGMGYGGSVGGDDIGGVYSSGYGSDYLSRGADVGGSSYSSLYSGRRLSSSGYLGSSGSRSYY